MALGLAAALIGLGCSSTAAGEGAGAGGSTATATSEDGSEVHSSVDSPSSLELISEIDITPNGRQAHRPDVTAVGSELWLAYGTSSDGMQLQRFDTELNPLGAAMTLEAPAEVVTDVRVGTAAGTFWYAYETVLQPDPGCTGHFLNVASYTAADPPTLALSATHIATGCPTTVEFMMNPTGVPEDPEAVDDPTPLYHGGVFYVLTRSWPGATTQRHHLRRLDDALEVASEAILDTSSLAPSSHMEQNVLVHIDGQPVLIAGFPSGPPAPPNTSALLALRLRSDLSAFSGEAIELAVPDVTYPQRVTRARHVNGTLILNYVDRYAGQPTREFLALFDVGADFSLRSQTQVQDHEVMDNHSSFEIVGDRLYLFQQQAGEKLSAKIFRLKP